MLLVRDEIAETPNKITLLQHPGDREFVSRVSLNTY
jgi:hypothetical protein